MLLLLMSHLGDGGEDVEIEPNAYSEVELPNEAVASCLWVFGEVRIGADSHFYYICNAILTRRFAPRLVAVGHSPQWRL